MSNSIRAHLLIEEFERLAVAYEVDPDTELRAKAKLREAIELVTQ